MAARVMYSPESLSKGEGDKAEDGMARAASIALSHELDAGAGGASQGCHPGGQPVWTGGHARKLTA